MKSKIIGLIGGCGAGKSEIARILRNEYDAFVIIADEIGHDILESNQAVRAELINIFGNHILDDQGRVVRAKLGEIVFSDSNKLQELNQIMHPIMRDAIQEIIEDVKKQEQAKLIVLEAAVMIEAGFINLVDEVWSVTCNLENRIQRLIQFRNFTREKALRIIASQPVESLFEGAADVIVDNSFSVAETRKQINQQVIRLLEEMNEI